MAPQEVLPHASEAELLDRYNSDFRSSVMPITVLFGLEIVFGVFGNLLTIYVFFFRYKSCNFRYFVLGLALTDLISCLTTIPAEMVSLIYWYNYPVPPYCRVKAYFNQFTVCAEAGCLVIIAVDRWRKVCKPFRWQIKKHVALYFCIGIYIVAGLLAIPTPIFWGVHTDSVVYEGRNITVTICEKADEYRDTKFPLANIVFNQSLVFIGLVTMFVLYILVSKTLILGHKEIKQRRNQEVKIGVTDSSMDMISSEPESDTGNGTGNFSRLPEAGARTRTGSSQECATSDESGTTDRRKKSGKDELTKIVRVRRKTMIMLYLTVIFIVTTVMYGILLSVVAFGILSKIEGARKAVYFFFLRLYFINHVINPVLYGLMDPQFRIEMRRIKGKLVQKCQSCSRGTEK